MVALLRLRLVVACHGERNDSGSEREGMEEYAGIQRICIQHTRRRSDTFESIHSLIKFGLSCANTLTTLLRSVTFPAPSIAPLSTKSPREFAHAPGMQDRRSIAPHEPVDVEKVWHELYLPTSTIQTAGAGNLRMMAGASCAQRQLQKCSKNDCYVVHNGLRPDPSAFAAHLFRGT